MKHDIDYRVLSKEDKAIWSLEEIKNYLRVVHKNDDKLIIDLAETAILSAEQFLGAVLLTQKIACTMQSAPDTIKVRYAPLVKVLSAELILKDSEEDIMKSFGHVNLAHNQIWIAPEYIGKKLKIVYEAGMGDNIPKNILHGILSHIGVMYDTGENAANVLQEIKDMYLPYRVLKI